MERYIDANKLIKKIFPIGLVDDGKYTINAKAVKHAIDQAPTEEVFHVVWCKDCIRCKGKADNGYYVCTALVHPQYVNEDHYCGYGERREE